ncbi:MAG: Gldg family protein [Verrucomicrobiota bacterium]|nr:Gldg family protein [Verrucomicrobiota bacterium]
MKESLRSAWKTSGGIVGFALVALIAIAANVILANAHIMRKDLTEDQLYVLSPGTRQILESLPGKVTLQFYFNRSEAEIPVQLKGFADRVEDLLKEYEIAGRGNIEIERFDPKPDSDQEQWAQKHGLSGQSLGLAGPTLYIGLVAIMGEREEALAFLDPRAEDLLEYNISRTVARVATSKKRSVGLISSLPVMGERHQPYAMPGMPEPPPPWFAFRDLRQDYDIREIAVPTETIGEEVDSLILAHPKQLTDETLYALDQFVLRGGRLMVFLDPFCGTEADSPMIPSQMRMGPKSSNLEKLLDAWGVTYDPGKVVADIEATTRVRGMGGRIEESLLWLSLRPDNLNQADILTSHMESIMMPVAGSFSVNETKDVKVTTLLSASGSSCLVDAMMAQFGGDALKREFKAQGVRLPLAVRLHGKLKTAFPDGKPAKKLDDEKADAKDAEADKKTAEKKAAKVADKAPPGLKESKTTSMVVLVGDVDMLYDRNCVQEVQFLGYSGMTPFNNNLTFFANLVEQMAGGQALAGIRTRGKIMRPFKRVLTLERRAQERYMERELQLQRKLEDAQRRLSELEGQKDKKQRMFLTRQQEAEIENFRKQVVTTKEELRQVRRNLREDIEQLGVKVKAINILLVPLLVAAAGVIAHVARRVVVKS